MRSVVLLALLVATPAYADDPKPWWKAQDENAIEPTRLVLHADGSAGLVGNKLIGGFRFGLRFRPVEFALHVIETYDKRNLVALGGDVMLRLPIGHSNGDLLVGGAASIVAPNGSTNPDFDGYYSGFAGIAYHTTAVSIHGGQPLVQLRAGVARGSELAPKAVPLVELHLGLATAERR